MSSTPFGAWVKVGETDNIFFDQNTISIHQSHIQLYEMVHMLCQHPTIKVKSSQTWAILRRAGVVDRLTGVNNLGLLFSYLFLLPV
jgi:hypothetical protein